MFGDSSDEDCEVLTPTQRVSAAEPAAPAPRGNAATPPAAGPPLAPADPAAPADPINHPAPIVPKIAAEFLNTRFGDYMSRAEKKKDI